MLPIQLISLIFLTAGLACQDSSRSKLQAETSDKPITEIMVQQSLKAKDLPRSYFLKKTKGLSLVGVGVITDWWQKRPQKIKVVTKSGQTMGTQSFPAYLPQICGPNFQSLCQEDSDARLLVPITGSGEGNEGHFKIIVDERLDKEQPEVSIKAIRLYYGTKHTILMAGQSNMVGGPDYGLFQQILTGLSTQSPETLATDTEKQLTDWYLNFEEGYASYGYRKEAVQLEAEWLQQNLTSGLVGNHLLLPILDSKGIPKVDCSWNKNQTKPLKAFACAEPLGPELLLGHTLTRSLPDLHLNLVKVATGGTSLHTDWLSPSAAAKQGKRPGYLYKDLANAIRNTQNPIHSFIWFQGEADAMEHGGDYKNNLRDLISDVRILARNPKLPVVIIQIGAWAETLDLGTHVYNVQEEVAAEDPGTIALVPTDHLSGYFHYDPIAQMMIGEAVAKALLSISSF